MRVGIGRSAFDRLEKNAGLMVLIRAIMKPPNRKGVLNYASRCLLVARWISSGFPCAELLDDELDALG
jgi:hypothetical protein